jgi:hypothetical protein
MMRSGYNSAYMKLLRNMLIIKGLIILFDEFYFNQVGREGDNSEQ